jgi:hypothetical protein
MADLIFTSLSSLDHDSQLLKSMTTPLHPIENVWSILPGLGISSSLLPIRLEAIPPGVDVAVRGKRFEMWSPNCFHGHFAFPGFMPAGFDFKTSASFKDGSFGKFDPGKVPQIISSKLLHLAFIDRYVSASCHTLETEPITQYWVSITGSRGFFHPDWLQRCERQYQDLMSQARILCRSMPKAWLERYDIGTLPTFPRAALENCSSLDEAWFPYRFTQITIAQLRTYVAMHLQLQSLGYKIDDNTGYPPEKVSSRFMGAWVSTLPSEDISVLLQLRVPVFVLHKYSTDVNGNPRPPTRSSCIDSFIQQEYMDDLRNYPINRYSTRPTSAPLYEKDWMGHQVVPNDPLLEFSSSTYYNWDLSKIWWPLQSSVSNTEDLDRDEFVLHDEIAYKPSTRDRQGKFLHFSEYHHLEKENPIMRQQGAKAHRNQSESWVVLWDHRLRYKLYVEKEALSPSMRRDVRSGKWFKFPNYPFYTMQGRPCEPSIWVTSSEKRPSIDPPLPPASSDSSLHTAPSLTPSELTPIQCASTVNNHADSRLHTDTSSMDVDMASGTRSGDVASGQDNITVAPPHSLLLCTKSHMETGANLLSPPASSDSKAPTSSDPLSMECTSAVNNHADVHLHEGTSSVDVDMVSGTGSNDAPSGREVISVAPPHSPVLSTKSHVKTGTHVEVQIESTSPILLEQPAGIDMAIDSELDDAVSLGSSILEDDHDSTLPLQSSTHNVDGNSQPPQEVSRRSSFTFSNSPGRPIKPPGASLKRYQRKLQIQERQMAKARERYDRRLANNKKALPAPLLLAKDLNEASLAKRIPIEESIPFAAENVYAGEKLRVRLAEGGYIAPGMLRGSRRKGKQERQIARAFGELRAKNESLQRALDALQGTNTMQPSTSSWSAEAKSS